MLCSKITGWLVGTCAFLLPVAIGVLGKHFDRSAFSHSPIFAAAVPWAIVGSLALSLVVPTALIMTARLRLLLRVVLTGATWCLLLLEIYLVFLVVAAGN